MKIYATASVAAICTEIDVPDYVVDDEHYDEDYIIKLLLRQYKEKEGIHPALIEDLDFYW